MRRFLEAVASPLVGAVVIAMVIVNIAWLHSPPCGHRWPAEQTTNAQPVRPPVNVADTLAERHPGTPAGGPSQPESNKKDWVDYLNALFTGAVALFTLALVCVGGVQARRLRETVVLTRQSVEAARADLVSTHRPRIFVRNVFCPFTGVDGTPIEIDFTIVNGGGNPARIDHSVMVVELFRVEGLMIVPVAVGGDDLNLTPATAILAPGESRVFRHISPVVQWSADANADWANPREGLFFSGHIVYADNNGTSRHTAFRRRYDPQSQRFYPIDDKEHEYAD